MDFNLKNYQTLKLKKYFKNEDFFLIFHSAKLSLAKWINIEQNLKKLKLEYYKPSNRVTLKAFLHSVYRNFSSNIGGFVIFLNSYYKSSLFNLEPITKSLKPSFVLIGIKFNSKIYSISQLKGIKNLSYKQNIFVFYRTLDKYLKTSYALTNKKKISK